MTQLKIEGYICKYQDDCEDEEQWSYISEEIDSLVFSHSLKANEPIYGVIKLGYLYKKKLYPTTEEIDNLIAKEKQERKEKREATKKKAKKKVGAK